MSAGTHEVVIVLSAGQFVHVWDLLNGKVAVKRAVETSGRLRVIQRQTYRR